MFSLKAKTFDDPANVPCLIVGLGRNINKLGFEDVKHKLKDKVSEEVVFILTHFKFQHVPSITN